ncbi:cell division control protein Cdc25 [Favolaschia claudopus]|uniref:Cell division control protein Cdc25 n=1 Tax=Favolaschia claudopus TaxID=2862362 RepID=A0AAW0D9W3_9AGAR
MPLSAADLERLRKFQLMRDNPELYAAPPESVHTDETEPEAPEPLTDGTPVATLYWLPMEQLCPSVMVPRRMLRQLSHPDQLPQMRQLVLIFHNSVTDVAKSIHSRQFLLRTDHIYRFVIESVRYSTRALIKQLRCIGNSEARFIPYDMERTLYLVDTAAKSLQSLHRVVEAYQREKLKALPGWPDDDESELSATCVEEVFDDEPTPESLAPAPVTDATISPITDNATRRKPDQDKSLPPIPEESEGDEENYQKSLPDIPVEVVAPELVTAPSNVGASAPVPDFPSRATKQATEITAPVAILKGPVDLHPHKTFSIIQRLLQLRADFAKLKAPKRSPLAVVNLNLGPSVESLASTLRPEPREDMPYIARQSYIYHRYDPLCPDQKVDMPLPTGELVAVRLDHNGDVKAASLPALIHLLTSHHVIPVDEMVETFYLSFRLFSSPMGLLNALLRRWDEQPPVTGVPLNAAQQRVWTHHMSYVRNCLAQLFLTWLEEYWRPDEDSCILPRLRAFVVRRFDDAGLFNGIATLLLQAIDRAKQQDHISRVQRARDIERQGAPPESGPLQIVLRPEDDYNLNIHVFETIDGRERFAMQITALAHRQFRELDPEAVVARWLTGEPTFYQIQELEEALLMWVAMSIVELQGRDERVVMIEFWLDVASICVNLRNFSSAFAIFSGLVYSPVERLSFTILDIAIPSKEQYRQLNTLFDGTNNYSIYRRLLNASSYPAVPLMLVLRKDVIATKEISGPIAMTNDPDAEKTLIHFNAYRKLQKTICTMEDCLVPYNIPPIRMIQDWIDKQLEVLPRAEHQAIGERMNKMSEELEPRAPPPIRKGQTWLQVVKGDIAANNFALYTLPEPGVLPPGPAKLRKNKSIATLLNLRLRTK